MCHLAGRGETTSSESLGEEMSEGLKAVGQDMAGHGETNSSESLGEERIELVQEEGQKMVEREKANPSFSMDEEALLSIKEVSLVQQVRAGVTLDQNDFANQPSKKLKCLQSGVLDDQLPSQTISSSLISECPDTISSESDNELFASPPLPPKKIENSLTYDHIQQDYTLTELDNCAQCVIQNAKEHDILVQIDEISIKKRFLKCLLDENKWLDDEVISAYICCLKEQAHVQNQNDSKVYYENPFVTRLLKQDGQSGIDGPTGMTKVVKNYMNHDMVHLPINIIDSHWYLATLNFEKCEFRVLDSLCWKHNRVDLVYTIQGLQHHLDILKGEENSIDPKWKGIDFTQWTITEQFQAPIQTDSSSCGLFILKFMEYWTGHTLSHVITQEIITKFRFKLAAILLCWKNNTAPPTTTIEERDYSEGDADDIMISDSPFDDNQSKELNSLFAENKYMSLMSVLSTLSPHELVGGLCNYIRSIKSAKVLEKIWVQSSLPYPISLTLKKLQEMLNEELTMDFHCFNLVVRMIMFDNIETVKKRGGFISKHCLDMQFWVHIPIKSNTGGYILFILEKDTKSVYILDPSPIEEMYKLNPHAKYVKRILWIAEQLPKAMSKECPGSQWNENIFLWKQNIVQDISFYKRELSGFMVTLFMSTWNDGKLHLPFIKDGYELRKQIVGQLLTFKQNTCEENMPTGVLDFINCIRKIQNK